jgi:hypothetical protein
MTKSNKIEKIIFCVICPLLNEGWALEKSYLEKGTGSNRNYSAILATPESFRPDSPSFSKGQMTQKIIFSILFDLVIK